MKDVWLNRLIAEIKRSGRPYRQISLAAGLGQNYVEQMINNRKSPATSAVLKICDELGVSVTYVFTGVRMSPQMEELLIAFSSLQDNQRDRFLDLLRSLLSSDAAAL